MRGGEVFNSAYLLGWLLTNRRPQEAIGYLEMAVEAGNHYSAAYALANLIINQDRQRAYELYRLSANAGNPDATISLSLMA